MSVENEEKQIEAYGEEDRKLLVSLLNEYSEKLARICKIIDVQSGENSSHLRTLTILLLVIIATGVTLFFCWKMFFPLGPFIIIILFAFIATYSTRAISEMSENRRETESLVRDARAIAKRLEKVVQIVSQMHEHSVNRVSIRIEMDLRLADAEIALEHYEALTQKDQQLGTFARSLTRSVLKIR